MLQKVIDYFRIESELESHDFVFEEIKKGIIFKGTNLWILIFAIILASVGLNMNSTAVIIGAMLISPLMGPINGMGYSIATYDFELFRQSIKNFSFAILSSLAASTAYFALSPVSTAHSEILARTSPTIYDVIIALFGGLAGIIAISSKQKGNVIPGVAIATALMPPLCTAGYGLATGQFTFFFGAFYLFTINTIFIAMASVWISQLLKFPIRTIVDSTRRKEINRTITMVILIVLLPSIYFGYRLVKQEDFMQRSKQFISNVSLYEGNFLLKHDIDPKENKIVLVYGGSALSEIQKQAITEKMGDFGIKDAIVRIEQGITLNKAGDENFEIYRLKEQILQLNQQLKTKNAEIDSIQAGFNQGKQLKDEMKVLFPGIEGCFYASSMLFHDTLTTAHLQPLIVVFVDNQFRKEDRLKVIDWLKLRLNEDNLSVYFE